MTIYLCFSLALFNMISQRAVRVLVTLYALTLGAEPLTIGLLAATFSLFPMLLSWHAGKISDRFGPRWPLTVGAVLGVCALLLPYFLPALGSLFVAAMLFGLGSTFYNVSLQNVVGMVSNAGNRARNYSNYTMVISVANSMGPLLAGFTIDRSGHAFTFLLIAGVLVAPAILLGIWGGALPGGRRNSGPSVGIRQALTNPQVWPVLAASSIAQSGLEMFSVYIPVYCHAHGMSASAIGAVIAMAAVGGFAARLMLTRLIAWLNEGEVLAYALFLGALSFVAVPFFSSAGALSLISFAFGFGLNCSQPISLIQIFNRS